MSDVQPQVTTIISAWFERNPIPSLALPDGWFGGRYGEGAHRLTYLEQRPRKLLIELDEQLLLSFTEVPAVSSSGEELVLSEFQQLVFDWQEYVNLTPHADRYSRGEVRFEMRRIREAPPEDPNYPTTY